jgi:hypothetical protein
MFSSLSSGLAAAIDGARKPSRRRSLLRAGLLAGALGVSACTSDNMLSLRPDVDVGTRTSALPRSGGMRELVPNDPYLAKQSEAAEPDYVEQQPETSVPGFEEQVQVALASPQQMGAPPRTLQQQAMDLDPQSLEEGTAEAGLPLAVEEPAADSGLPLAVDQAPPEESGLPLAVAPVEVNEPFDADQPIGEEEPVEAAPRQSTKPVLVAYPRMDAPVDDGPGPLSNSEITCRRELKKLGVDFRDLRPINDSKSCRIEDPVKVSMLPGKVQLKPAATLSCQMALTLARWTKNELNPAARRRYWSRVKTIHQMSSYSCRRINGSRTMSEHSKGNAIDIGRIELTSGRDIDVEKKGLFAFRSKGFLNSVRAEGCEYFTTVLGPGYNRDHRDHFHFDIKPRRNGRHACH